MNENSLVVKENLLRQLRLETQKLKKAEEDYDDLYAGMAETLRAKDDEIAALLDKLKAADDLLAFSQVSKPGSPRQLAISGVASNIILTPPKAENPNLKLAEENEQLKDEIKGLRLQLDKAKQAGLKQDDNYQLLMNEVSKL